jgi:hypothetical protein
MNRLRARLAAGDDAGSVTLFVVISTLGLLLIMGLVTDGGAKLRATQRADAIAAEAARAGGQMLDVPTVVSGAGITVDRQGAATAALAYLAAVGQTGDVTLGPDGTTLTVTVTTTSPTVFLALVGISTLTVTGHGQVALVHGVTGGGT